MRIPDVNDDLIDLLGDVYSQQFALTTLILVIAVKNSHDSNKYCKHIDKSR